MDRRLFGGQYGGVKLDVAFGFNVGVVESHESICVDGEEVLRESHFFGVKKTRLYKTTVGVSEFHAVVIEKTIVAGGLSRSTERWGYPRSADLPRSITAAEPASNGAGRRDTGCDI